MAFWKQLALTLGVLAAALLAWVWFVPGAGDMLSRFGVPEQVIGAISPAPSQSPEQVGEQAQNQRSGAASGQAGSAQGQGRAAAPGGAAAGGGRGAGGAPMVVAMPVTIGRVNDRLSAIGSGEAFQSVTVTPQVSGTLSEIGIASGERVSQGQVIARLNDDEQVIALDQAKVELKSATEKSQLFQNLKSTVSRIDAFDADIALETARLAVETAELNLKRREILAPIDGIAGIITVNPGDNVTTTTSIVTLDDRSQILVDFWVPERFAPIIKVGQPVEATAVARPAGLYTGAVEAIDNRIDAASRTLHVRARIENENDDLRAGMSFSVTMMFDGEPYPAVDPLSIQWDSDGSYVWQVAEGKAKKVPVRIVQRNPDTVLVEAALGEGAQIVVEGVQRVRAGAPVTVAGDDPQKGPATQ